MKYAFLFLLLTCGCTCTVIRTEYWSLYRVSVAQKLELPRIEVVSNTVTCVGYSSKGDTETVAAAVEAGVKAGLKSGGL